MTLRQTKKKPKIQQNCLTPKLTVELVPTDLWGRNLRSFLTPSQWDILRFEQFGKADFKCQICGGVGSEWPVECHEIWTYDDTARMQTLIGLIALCPMCHFAKHLGRSLSTNVNYYTVRDHIAQINEWDQVQLTDYVNEQFKIFHKRSTYLWTQNLEWIKKRQDILNYKPSEKYSDENFY